MTDRVTGEREVIAVIGTLMAGKLAAVAEAVEKSAVEVSNDAKRDHQRGSAHQKQRYENQTNILTNSITVAMVETTEEKVVAEVGTNVEYASFIETTHPFLFPALHANREKFHQRVKKAFE